MKLPRLKKNINFPHSFYVHHYFFIQYGWRATEFMNVEALMAHVQHNGRSYGAGGGGARGRAATNFQGSRAPTKSA